MNNFNIGLENASVITENQRLNLKDRVFHIHYKWGIVDDVFETERDTLINVVFDSGAIKMFGINDTVVQKREYSLSYNN